MTASFLTRTALVALLVAPLSVVAAAESTSSATPARPAGQAGPGGQAAPTTAASTARPAEYATVRMEIDVAKPAAEVWARVGKYCDIAEWLKFECKITSGDGGMGTVRSLANGRVVEILVAKTDLSYGYTQPAVEGRFYNLYHGFMEAKPVSATSSKLIYTLVLDVSDKADQAAKDADLARRRTQFEGALKEMKRLAEGK